MKLIVTSIAKFLILMISLFQMLFLIFLVKSGDLLIKIFLQTVKTIR